MCVQALLGVFGARDFMTIARQLACVELWTAPQQPSVGDSLMHMTGSRAIRQRDLTIIKICIGTGLITGDWLGQHCDSLDAAPWP